VIDLHAHVLPGIDDGPRTLADAIVLARAAREAGVDTIAATSHVDRRWARSVAELTAARAELRAALARAGVDVDVVAGGEIALDRLIDLTEAELAGLALGGGGALLVECPLASLPGDFTWPVRRLLADGWCVVLAHPERSPAFQDRPQLLAELTAMGAHGQVTTPSLSGDFGALAQRAGLAMLRAGTATLISSDAHDARRRPPGFAAARAVLEREAPDVAARWGELTRATPGALLARQRGSSG
jgi:protein-tyrosine phosphatase